MTTIRDGQFAHFCIKTVSYLRMDSLAAGQASGCGGEPKIKENNAAEQGWRRGCASLLSLTR